MRGFIRTSILFAAGPLLYFTLNATINRWIISNTDLSIPHARVLILGDSHVKFGVDPSLFSSAVNMAQAAEPYALSLWKLRRFLDASYKPDTVIIGFAPHNLAEFQDVKFSDTRWANAMMVRSYTLVHPEQYRPLNADMTEYWRVMFRRHCLYPVTDPFKFIGRFKGNDHRSPLEPSKAIERHYADYPDIDLQNTKSMVYLDSIIQLCRDFEIVPILLSTPVSQHYYKAIPPDHMNHYESLVERFDSDGLSIFNFLSVAYPDSVFSDTDHLNVQGAEQFSKELVSSISGISYHKHPDKKWQ